MDCVPTPEPEVIEPPHTAQTPRKSAGRPCGPSKKTLRKQKLINRNKRHTEYQEDNEEQDIPAPVQTCTPTVPVPVPSMSKDSMTDETHGAEHEQLSAPSCGQDSSLPLRRSARQRIERKLYDADSGL